MTTEVMEPKNKKLICPNCGHIMARSERGINRAMRRKGCSKCGMSGDNVVHSLIGNLIIPHWRLE